MVSFRMLFSLRKSSLYMHSDAAAPVLELLNSSLTHPDKTSNSFDDIKSGRSNLDGGELSTRTMSSEVGIIATGSEEGEKVDSIRRQQCNAIGPRGRRSDVIDSKEN